MCGLDLFLKLITATQHASRKHELIVGERFYKILDPGQDRPALDKALFWSGSEARWPQPIYLTPIIGPSRGVQKKRTPVAE